MDDLTSDMDDLSSDKLDLLILDEDDLCSLRPKLLLEDLTSLKLVDEE